MWNHFQPFSLVHGGWRPDLCRENPAKEGAGEPAGEDVLASQVESGHVGLRSDTVGSLVERELERKKEKESVCERER